MTIREKQPMQGILDGTTIRNLPIPCSVFTVEGEFYEVDDGDAELTLNGQGLLRDGHAVPYLTQVFTVDA